jgi:hypothetical protein
MPAQENPDAIIAREAEQFAARMKAKAKTAKKEEEIRIEAERALAFIEAAAGIKLDPRHEFTVAKGRIDSVYDQVIIEYKNPSSSADRIGPRVDSPGTRKVVAQIKTRFLDLHDEHGQPLNSLLGVGLDGNRFVFVRFRDGEWDVREPVEVDRTSAAQFLWALFNLGRRGKPFSPEYLAADFGPDSGIARSGVQAFYDAICRTDNPKAQIFFKQWKILFAEASAQDLDTASEKVRALAASYGVPTDRLQPAKLFFALHGYYAVLMKLFASEIVAFFHNVPTPLRRIIGASTSAKLKHEMEELERGSIFRHFHITNFLEGDLFA